MVSVLPPSIHACRPVGDPCSTPSRPRIGDAKLVNHAQGSKGRGHIVARGARDGPAGMPRLVQRAMLALAILAALVVGASARDHAPAGIDGGQTSGALFAAQQVASVDDASSGGLPRVHRARKLIEADPRYGSAVRRVLNDVESGGNWSQVGADIDGEAAVDCPGLGIDVLGRHARGDRRDHNDGTGTTPATCACTRERRDVDPGGADIDGEAAATSGYSVSMSSDGTRVAIGATMNDGTGDSPATCGVRRERRDVDPGGCRHRRRGCVTLRDSVSMSSDGTRVAIGAPYNDGRHYAGHVRVYAESGGTWTQVGPTSTARLRATAPGTRYRCPRTARAWRSALWNDGAATTPATCGCTPRAAGRGPRWAPTSTARLRDDSGYSVSMSSDGTRVAIGAMERRHRH